MNSNAVIEPHVHARVGLVEVPVARCDEGDRKISHVRFG